MMSSLDESDLTESLARMPRAQASEDFTERVMSRLEARSANGATGPLALRWVVVTVTALAIGLWIGTMVRDRQLQRLAYRQKVEALRSQYEQIQNDVDQLRRDAADSPTVVYLGGNERFDLVLDLADLGVYDSDAGTVQTRPVNYRK